MTGAVGDTLRSLIARGDLDLPDPASGRTSERLLRLFELARTHPVSVARLAEAHTDAVSILHEAGRTPEPGAIYGVWASASRAGVQVVTTTSSPDTPPAGARRLRGVKPFASGLGIVDRALVTVDDEGGHGGPQLLDVAVGGSSVRITTDQWTSSALRDSATGVAEFVDHAVSPSEFVGDPGWYLERVGFWQGACAPAACWAGSAAGLLDAAEQLIDDDPHRLAHLGALRASTWALRAVLCTAGRRIDESPDDVETAHACAHSVRYIVERQATDILDRFGRAFGPRPFTTDASIAQRWADTHLYLRQFHGERDLAALGQAPWTI
jgi:alkylation response protein AidB-like acyl-CoA dehydrogenase